MFYAYGTNVEVCGYANIDWIESTHDRRSMSGYVFSLGNGAINWSSKKQPKLDFSNMEEEYKGTTMPACEVAWLCKLLHSLGHNVKELVALFCNNMSNLT